MTAKELRIGNLVYKCYPDGNEIIQVEKIERTSGHGESCVEKTLATYGGYDEIEYPAFTNKEDAQAFIDKIQSIHFFKPQITEIKIWSNED